MAQETQILLYQGTHKIFDEFEIWTRKDIARMIETINNSQDYLKNGWGKWMKARDKLIIMMIFEHACRVSEIVKLRFTDFRANGTFMVRKENNKQKKDRIIPICERVKIYLAQYLNFPKYFWKGSFYLFPSFVNSYLSAERWKHIFREKVLKPSGLFVKPEIPAKSRTRSYLLRHSRATELLQKTADIYAVANILGHGNINSSKCYLHPTSDYFSYLKKCINL